MENEEACWWIRKSSWEEVWISNYRKIKLKDFPLHAQKEVCKLKDAPSDLINLTTSSYAFDDAIEETFP